MEKELKIKRKNSAIKRIFACMLAVVMLICAVPMAGNITATAAGGVKAKLDSIMSTYPSGSRWTGTFDGGSQCYGFGKLVIYNIFGKSGSSYRSWSYAGVSTSGMNTVGSITSYSSTNVKNLLSKAKCGDILQFDTTKQHTMVVYSVESDGVWIYDCNWDNNCGISFRKCPFGTWSGRNSSKLTLLHSNNYDSIDGPAVTHSINSSYGKNFTAYLKNPSGQTPVYDENHNLVSGRYISGNDPCTIHEVYTDGCCKVSYVTDSGITRTYYTKYSYFNAAHTHSYSEYYEAAHPHKVYKKCSCGDWSYTGATKATYTSSVTKAATCTANGVKTFKCNLCTYSYTEAIKATGHSYSLTETSAATCTQDGFKTYKCSKCSNTYVESIAATGHSDNNSDGKCDACGDATCTHICHKTGFSAFFYKIARAFWKAFHTNQYCSCGAAHY